MPLRELSLNGYIDDEVWYGDEITPESLHGSLYGPNNEYSDDVHIRLNSYGGSCNAAVRMFDDIRAYPGSVSITVSGTAASAATVLCMAADQLEMTPGSLFMIHDPSTMAYGNERDLQESINVLRACKESILNMYERRVRVSRVDTAAMMTAVTWMDARAAYDYGFVDRITEDTAKYPADSVGEHKVDAEMAMAAVEEWFERKKHPAGPAAVISPEPKLMSAIQSETHTDPETVPDNDRVKVDSTDTRLNELKY